MKAKNIDNNMDAIQIYPPTLVAMVRDGLYPDIETAKTDLSKFYNKYYAKKKLPTLND